MYMQDCKILLFAEKTHMPEQGTIVVGHNKNVVGMTLHQTLFLIQNGHNIKDHLEELVSI